MRFRKRNGKFGEDPEVGDEFGDELKVVTLWIDGQEVHALHMSQMPVMRVLPILAEADGMAQLNLLMGLLKDALLDPSDWETHLLPAKLEVIGGILETWTQTMDLGFGGKAHGKKKRR